jgi:tetratricopeptide (TPR) repeat protein
MGLSELSRYTPTGLQAAIGHFSTAIELDPALVDARLYLVECFQSLFEWQELPVDQMRMLAEPQIERALEVDPDSARAHSKLGIVLAQSGDVEGAERAMQRAVTLNPNSARVREEYARVLLNYAAKPAAALDQIDAAAMLEPLARSRVQQSMRGRALGMLGRSEEAMRQFDALMAAFPDDVGVYVDLASIAPTGSEAMRWWRLCAERAPTVAACPAVVAGLLMNYDQYDEAERWLNLAAGRDPDSGWIWIMRFFLRARLGDEPGMEAATDRAIEYGSRASGAEYLYSHRHLRWLLARDPERVEAYYQRYYPHLMKVDPQVNPRTYAAAISLAFLLVERGELARAQTLLDRSLRVVEDTPEAWFLTDKLLGLDAKAMIYTLQGDHDRALTRLTQQAADAVAWNWQILEGEPIYRRLHEHPSFQELLSKLRSSDGMALEMSRVRDMEEKGLILPLSAYPEA